MTFAELIEAARPYLAHFDFDHYPVCFRQFEADALAGKILREPVIREDPVDVKVERREACGGRRSQLEGQLQDTRVRKKIDGRVGGSARARPEIGLTPQALLPVELHLPFREPVQADRSVRVRLRGKHVMKKWPQPLSADLLHYSPPVPSLIR